MSAEIKTSQTWTYEDLTNPDPTRHHQSYRILGVGEAKIGIAADEWTPCVVYQSIVTNDIYVRDEDTFKKKFNFREEPKRKPTQFDEWWKLHWARDIQPGSKLENACRYAFTDGLAVNQAKIDKAIKDLENLIILGDKEWETTKAREILLDLKGKSR